MRTLGALQTALEIRQLLSIAPEQHEQLAELLIAVVDDGASIGFLPPVGRAEAKRYWAEVPGPAVVLLVAEQDGRIQGCAQLHLTLRANGLHRAEVAKLMVHPRARRQGLGRLLMQHLEDVARREGRSLLVLDTREGDPSNHLYLRLGYIQAGRIPSYARSANGQLHTTVFYYKALNESPPAHKSAQTF